MDVPLKKLDIWVAQKSGANGVRKCQMEHGKGIEVMEKENDWKTIWK
jgi:hypothetical protein